MTLKQKLHTRRGNIGLTVYQNEKTGQLLFSFDKFHEAQLQKTSGLFTEKELAAFNDFIQDHFEYEHLFYTKKNHPTPDSEMQTHPAEQIQNAILCAQDKMQSVTTEPPANSPKCTPPKSTTSTAKITVLPTLPKYRYVHTCSKCGCHVASTATIGCTQILICSYCLHALPAML